MNCSTIPLSFRRKLFLELNASELVANSLTNSLLFACKKVG